MGGTNCSLIVRGDNHRYRFIILPALSFVPEAREPPNGCWATTAPVGLSFMKKLPAECLNAADIFSMASRSWANIPPVGTSNQGRRQCSRIRRSVGKDKVFSTSFTDIARVRFIILDIPPDGFKNASECGTGSGKVNSCQLLARETSSYFPTAAKPPPKSFDIKRIGFDRGTIPADQLEHCAGPVFNGATGSITDFSELPAAKKAAQGESSWNGISKTVRRRKAASGHSGSLRKTSLHYFGGQAGEELLNAETSVVRFVRSRTHRYTLRLDLFSADYEHIGNLVGLGSPDLRA